MSQSNIANVGLLERTFRLRERHTTVRTEAAAGVTTFMTMAYILAVNPLILSDAGMDRGAVFIRGCYSEFIVAAALGIDLSEPRANWEPWDLTLYEEANAIHIEVKSGSYLQAWKQNHPSTIRFGIQPTICWSPTNGYTGEPHRQSDVYVFCVFAEQDAAKADPMKLDSWEFYVLPTKELDKHCGVQRTISLNALLRLSPQKVDFADLKSAVLQSV